MVPSKEAQEFYYEVVTAASTRSFFCATRPKLRNRLCKCIFAVWPAGDPTANGDLENSASTLTEQATNYYKQVYGNPLLAWILFEIAKILITLLIEWWLNRQNTRAAIIECSNICNAAGVNLESCFE